MIIVIRGMLLGYMQYLSFQETKPLKIVSPLKEIYFFWLQREIYIQTCYISIIVCSSHSLCGSYPILKNKYFAFCKYSKHCHLAVEGQINVTLPISLSSL